MRIALFILCLLTALAAAGNTAGEPAAPETDAPEADGAVHSVAAEPSWDTQRAQAALERLQFLVRSGHAPFAANAPKTRRDRFQVDAAETLLDQLFASPDPDTRLRALELCTASGQPAHTARLATALEDPEPRVRERAAEALAAVHPADLVRRVIALLGVPGRDVTLKEVLPALRGVLQEPMLDLLQSEQAPESERILAACALGHMGGREMVAPLASRAAGDASPQLSLACAWALLSLREPSTVEHWLAFSRHEDERMRALAIDGLGTLGGGPAIERLFEVAQGDGVNGPWLQAQAVRYIGRQPGREAVPMLVTVMEKNPGMRREAVSYLRQLTRLDFGETPRLWREWLENPAAFMPEPEGEPEGAPLIPDEPTPLSTIGTF